MPDLADLLEQRKKSIRLLDRLHANDGVVWLKGPSGAGKTELAKLVMSRWQVEGGKEIYIPGDRDQRDTAFFPFYRALRAWYRSKSVRRVLRDDSTTPLKSIPVIGNTLSFLLRLAGAAASRTPEYVTEDEANLLSDLQSFATAPTNPRLLLVLDNIHWLDESSCRLLRLLLSNDIRAVYSFACRLRLLCIETDDPTAVLKSEFLKEIREKAVPHVTMELPARELFPLILKAMGLQRELTEDVIAKLYAVTRGHLNVAKQIVRIANENGVETSKVALANSLPEIVVKLLEARMQAVELPGGKVERLLRIAACIGQTFSHQELQCAFADPDGFASALEVATREEYLRDGVELTFAHEVIQSALVARGELPDYHAKLTECFKILRPADYVSRFRHALLAEAPLAASQLAFAVRMQRLRGDRPPGAPEFEATIDGNLTRFHREMDACKEAIALMDSGTHERAISLLGEFSACEGIVGAEIKYLLALNYFKLRTLSGYRVSQSILSNAVAETDEIEPWCRLMSTQAVALANLGRGYEADQVRTQVIGKLAKVDEPWARTQRMILHRKASAFMPPEPASGEIEAAVKYFAPSEGAEMPRQAFQYLAALVNFSGILFVRGKYEKAANAATNALELHGKLSANMRTVEPYKICNNLAIACLRCGLLSAADTAEFMRLASHSETPTRDRVLFLNNLAVAEALSGNIAGARERLQTLSKQVSAARIDSYYYYAVTSNLAAILHLTGETHAGIQLWRSLLTHIPNLPEYDSDVLMFRQSSFETAFEKVPISDVNGWDSFMSQNPPEFGESWFLYRYGFFLSDIQVWSES